MEKSEVNGNESSAMNFFLIGLGAGVSLTLLFAPLKGTETRRLIGRKVRHGTGWMKDKSLAAKHYVLTQGAEVRDRVKEVAEVIGRG